MEQASMATEVTQLIQTSVAVRFSHPFLAHILCSRKLASQS